MFLLKYVGDVELRRLIHAETNKSEQFNGFAKKAILWRRRGDRRKPAP
jgi:TnpA family transposase